MTILVTGGAGFIASYVIKNLQKKGHKVITNVRNNSWKNNTEYAELLKDVDVYNIDIRDQSAMRSLIEKCDGVIHLAGILGTAHIDNPKNFYEVNLFGAINILEACKEYHTPVVFIGVGNYWMHNNYSNSKHASERELLKYVEFLGVRGNIVRALNAVGGRQKVKNTGKIMSTFITKALNNEPITVYGGKDKCSIMDMVYAGDVANVLVDVLEKTISKEYNGQTFEAGTGLAYSVYELAEKVIKATNSKSEIIELPMRAGEPEKSEVVARNPYPIEYKDIDTLIKETISYYASSTNNSTVH